MKSLLAAARVITLMAEAMTPEQAADVEAKIRALDGDPLDLEFFATTADALNKLVVDKLRAANE